MTQPEEFKDLAKASEEEIKMNLWKVTKNVLLWLVTASFYLAWLVWACDFLEGYGIPRVISPFLPAFAALIWCAAPIVIRHYRDDPTKP